MKIRFRQTGGFAGLTKALDVDLEQIDDESEVKQLKALVEQAKRTPESTQDPLPDEEQVYIEVQEAEGTREIIVGRSRLPPELKPLVDYCAKRATYEKH